MANEYIECVVLAEKGIQYGELIPHPDPSKPPIDKRRLYERGEIVNIRKDDFMDFDEINKKRDPKIGQNLEVSYRRTGRKLDAVAQASAAGVDVDALRKQIREEVSAEVREMVKIQMEQQALARQSMVSAPGGRK